MLDFFKERAATIPFPNAIGEIEAMSLVEGQRRAWAPEVVNLLDQSIPFGAGYVLVEAYQRMTGTQMESILDAVRNRLLDSHLGITRARSRRLGFGPSSGGVASRTGQPGSQRLDSRQPQCCCKRPGVSQQITRIVEPMDQGSLSKYLSSVGLQERDARELLTAIDADGKPRPRQLGDRVKRWIAETAPKALDVTLKVALETAPGLLKKAIFHYYGWQ
jgi:AbiTii